MLDHSGRESRLGTKRPNISLLWPCGSSRGAFCMQKTGSILYCRFLLCNLIPRTVVGGLQFNNSVAHLEALLKFQYRERSREGCNTVPLSPWGYWPQMSKLENLSDFPAFRPSAPRALFGISSSRAAESLATQGFAVFGKKLENLRPFWGSKRFSAFYSIASHASFVHLQRSAVAWRR